MNHISKALLLLALMGALIPLSGAVVYLPQTLNATAPSPLVDFLSGLTLVIGTMIIGKVLQYAIRMVAKAKKGIIGGGVS